MTLPGETIHSGAPDHNQNPNVSRLQVLSSAAGYYIGTTIYDEEGDLEFPYTRESVEYYASFEEASDALVNNTFTPRI